MQMVVKLFLYIKLKILNSTNPNDNGKKMALYKDLTLLKYSHFQVMPYWFLDKNIVDELIFKKVIHMIKDKI